MPAKIYKGALVDIDGVLVDSETIHYEVFRDFFKEFGVTLTPQMHIDYWIREDGRGTKGIIEDFKLNLNLDYARKKRVEMLNERLAEIKPREGARDFLEYLHILGVPMVAVTSNYENVSVPLLKRLDFLDHFRDVITCEYIHNRYLNAKPHPDPYVQAAMILRKNPSECVGFEDAPKGIISMKEAGIGLAVAVEYGWTKDMDFSGKAVPDIRVASLAEVINLGLF